MPVCTPLLKSRTSVQLLDQLILCKWTWTYYNLKWWVSLFAIHCSYDTAPTPNLGNHINSLSLRSETVLVLSALISVHYFVGIVANTGLGDFNLSLLQLQTFNPPLRWSLPQNFLIERGVYLRTGCRDYTLFCWNCYKPVSLFQTPQISKSDIMQIWGVDLFEDILLLTLYPKYPSCMDLLGTSSSTLANRA